MSGANTVRNAIYQLLTDEPFYAHFILNSNIVYDKFKVPTAGVGVVNGVPTFIFNSSFLAGLSEKEVKTVLKHEVLHLTLDHVGSTKHYDHNDRYLWNIAQDCVINQYLSDLPKDCITLALLSTLVNHPLTAFETSDYYYSFLKKEQEKVNASGAKTMDEHDPDMGDRGNSQVNKAAIRGIAQKAVTKAAGNAPQAVVDALAMGGEASLPWKQLLRNFIFQKVSNVTLNTQKKVNRRFAMPVPGKKKKRTMTLGVCTDSSGSVSDEQYASFMREIQSIAKQVELTWLVQADSVVQQVEKLTSKVKLKPSRAGYGGTAYQPAIDKCKELGCDVIIYFGDFDTSDLPVDPKVPFLWVGVGNQAPPASFGKVLRLGG